MAKSKSARTHGPKDSPPVDQTFVKVGGIPNRAGRTKRPRAVPSQALAQPRSHLAVLEPIPESAAADPLDYADKHLLSLVPLAAKEKEWQLKFGSDDKRDRVATEVLAMKGIAAKRDAAPVVQPAIVLIQPVNNPFAVQVQQPTVVQGVHRVLPASTQGTGAAVGEEEGP